VEGGETPATTKEVAVATFTRRAKRLARVVREARMFARAMQSPRHPILAQVVVTRRCNLACTYCNEFDRVSLPVPTADLLRRVDRLADLGTSIITVTGGESLLHPKLDTVIARIRERGAMAVLLTNGFLLNRDRIRRLNHAGLDYLQLSIDNIEPDAVSKKSLSLLDRRLEELAACAEFQVTINSVVGAGANDPEDAHTIALRARALGFTSTVGVVHDGAGQLRPLGARHRDVVDRILRLAPSLFSFAQLGHFQENVIRGVPNRWHCRAGGRFLYICEDGLVHYCSQQRGRPGIPLETYSAADLAREADFPKPCAPFCTLSCVHQVAMLDSFRERPAGALAAMMDERKKGDPGFKVPMLVTLLSRTFLDQRRRTLTARVALRMLRVKRQANHADAPRALPAGGRREDYS
jgi:MoaA/NifB/PqqE/SkfB family radical SAM enzyme